ncbi:MAG: NAD(P)-dependent oxidoreductase, partial [Halobacteriales archaeon]|nr:NAD(P)-dependent oxidoreductase [Halobacteriales archaeon]
MPPSFDVYVSRDDRIEERGYTMGFERLWDDSDIELTFMPERAYGELRPDDLDGADGLILLKESVTADSLAGNDDLKVISRFGAGFDNVDLAAATDHGIVVTNAPQGMRGSVAQATVGMLIVCASHMRRYDRIVRTQGFEDRLENMGVELFGKTLGTIGLGQIGSRVAELLGPFDMTVKTYDPYLSDDRAAQLGVETVDLDTLLATSDFVTIH